MVIYVGLLFLLIGWYKFASLDLTFDDGGIVKITKWKG